MSVDSTPSLKEGFIFRSAVPADIPAMADLLNLHWEPLLGVRKITSADLEV